MSDTTNTALSEEAYTELDSFLLSDACDDETLTVDEAHGLLTALIIAPEPTETEVWLETVWGEPDFADKAEALAMTELMLRLYEEIETSLQKRHDFEPLAVEVEEDEEVIVAYEGWCYGFMLGVEMQEAVWEALPEDEQNLLAPIAKLALLSTDEEQEQEMEDDEYAAWVELLPGAVMGLYAYMHPA